MSDALKLPAEALRLTIASIDFDLPGEAPPDQAPILGQKRARSALQFGTAMPNPGYNVFVMGEPGTGRLTMVTNHLEVLSKQQETPPAYAYVDNFSNPREPVAIRLPPAMGQVFHQDIETLIDNLLATFPAAFESPSYQQKKTAIERSFNQRYNNAIDLVEKQAAEMHVALFRDSDGITFAPLQDNKPIMEEQFNQLTQEERDTFHARVEKLEELLGDALLELPQWRREMMDNLKKLDNSTIRQAIQPLFRDLHERYRDVPDVAAYLEEIKNNLLRTAVETLLTSQPVDTHDSGRRQLLVEQYLPNILVDCKKASGTPVIYEPHPTYQNLFGRIEYSSDQGTLVTSYRRICPGSLHRANGGYLILEAEKLLTYPFVWEGLKRALKSHRIEIESPYSELGINTITLKPQVIDLEVKIILVGSREIYYLLQEMDNEFNEMFRILADFDTYIQRSPETMRQFAALMLRQAAKADTRPLQRGAIERLIEHSCRLAEHQQRLSARINDCLEIIGEADLLRSQSENIEKQHIEQALAAREQRNGRMARQVLEQMLDDTILIDTEGSAIGKVNGLTVIEVGGSSFGAPGCITATVYPGSRGIVDIEREVELGQVIHSKGVMILTGYLGHRYAQQFPLAISASIAIEQSLWLYRRRQRGAGRIMRPDIVIDQDPDTADLCRDRLHQPVWRCPGGWRHQRKNRGLFPSLPGPAKRPRTRHDHSQEQCPQSDAEAGSGRCRRPGRIFHLCRPACRSGAGTADRSAGRLRRPERQLPGKQRQWQSHIQIAGNRRNRDRKGRQGTSVTAASLLENREKGGYFAASITTTSILFCRSRLRILSTVDIFRKGPILMRFQRVLPTSATSIFDSIPINASRAFRLSASL